MLTAPFLWSSRALCPLVRWIPVCLWPLQDLSHDPRKPSTTPSTWTSAVWPPVWYRLMIHGASSLGSHQAVNIQGKKLLLVMIANSCVPWLLILNYTNKRGRNSVSLDCKRLCTFITHSELHKRKGKKLGNSCVPFMTLEQ